MNVRQVRKKTKSVSNVKKITRSMQLVSAIKMKKAQQAAIEARPYQQELELVIKKVMTKVNVLNSPFLVTHAPDNAQDLVVVLTGNKGLCGSFNIDLFRYIANNVDIQNSKFITIGKKGAQFLSKTGGDILADYSHTAPLNNVTAVITFALETFLKGQYKRVFVLYNSYISTLKTEPILAQILPYKLQLDQKIEEKEYIEYVIEPSPSQIIERILRSFVEEKVRNAIIQSEAGEHSARMIAMKNATDNANDVIYNLTLLGNKLRQEKITSELLDMITAKESVEAG
ncbi:MAG: ATP synthase F1 subunit gamma [Candidatus Roizmanbacteria bacterium]|nr:ATP synthase F1 subunit gamma [Candidatus Roizmanbacteria bacterium]